MDSRATRAKRAPRKTKNVTPPLTKEDVEEFNEAPANPYAPKQKIGGPVIGQEKITKVGLGGLKVTTNGRDNY